MFCVVFRRDVLRGVRDGAAGLQHKCGLISNGCQRCYSTSITANNILTVIRDAIGPVGADLHGEISE